MHMLMPIRQQRRVMPELWPKPKLRLNTNATRRPQWTRKLPLNKVQKNNQNN